MAIVSEQALDASVASEENDENEDLFGQSTLFDNINYMGRAVIGSTVSNVEANAILAELYEYNTDSKVTLAVPFNPDGFVRILDDKKEILHSDPVKSVLYCTKSASLPNCFAFTSGKKDTGMYYCHAFKCSNKDICMRVLNTMATTFNKGFKKGSISDGTLEFEFDLSMEMLEGDGTGNLVPVAQEKDVFKIREGRQNHMIVTVRQSNSSTLILERCCGLFLGPMDSDNPENFSLLDMPIEMEMGTVATGPIYVIKGVWDPSSQPCPWLTDEYKGHAKGVSIAVDVVASGVLDPIRFTHKTNFKIFPANERFFLSSRYLSQQSFTVKLRPNTEDKHRRFGVESVTPKVMTSSPSRLRSLFSGIGFSDDYSDDYSHTESEDEEPLISGTAEVIEAASEEQLKTWNNLLDGWTDYCTRPTELVKLARKGIPNSLRAQVWLRLGGLTKVQVEENYKFLYAESMHNDCPHEQVILWDLNRTFPGNEFFQEGKDGQRRLYHVCKSYAGSDPEVGYCQGLSFIVAVLLLHLPEEETFALFSVIMKEYGFRDMFKKGFQMLQLKFYILERIIQDNIPELWEHFQDHELNTHMYASQWFLTLFSAKFPLGLVYRIVDMFLTEGPDTLFKIAVSLLKLSKSDLLSQDFEGMLKFFRVSLPKKFMNKKQGQRLLSTASSVKIKQGKVAIWEAEFHKLQDEKRSLEDPIRRLEHELKQSIETNHRLEQENDMLVQHLTQNQVNMRHQLDELEKRNLELKRDLSKMTTAYEEVKECNAALSNEILKTKNLYHSSLLEGDDERARHKLTIQEYHTMCRSLEEQHEKEKQELNQEVIEIKAKLGGKDIDISSEQRLRQLEMELAKTKLCLVEANCKAQEYEHRNSNLHEKLKTQENAGMINQLKAKLNR